MVENSRSARLDACPHGVQLLAAFFHLSFDDFKGHWVGYFIELVFVVELLFGVDLFGLLGLQPGVEGDASMKVCVRVFWGWFGRLGNLSFSLKPVLKENRKKDNCRFMLSRCYCQETLHVYKQQHHSKASRCEKTDKPPDMTF